MADLFSKYSAAPSDEEVKQAVAEILPQAASLYAVDILKRVVGLIDLTTLNATDTIETVRKMCTKVNEFHQYPRFVGMPNVAAICVYPSLVAHVREFLTDKYVRIASVAGGFPASQTYLNLKSAEIQMAVADGADDIDVVMPVGKFLNNDLQGVFQEISEMKKAAGKAHLKVILETGALSDMASVWHASILAMEAGADFIKTSTGKGYPPASLDAVYVMTKAIAEYNQLTGRKVGIKPSGGITTGMQAVEFVAIVRHNLGKEWFTPTLFRIGASSLANNILTEINKLNGAKNEVIFF